MVILRIKELGVDTLLEVHGKENYSWNARRVNLRRGHELEVLSPEGFEVVVHVMVMGSAGSGRRR